MRNYYTCTACGETWESRMAGRPVPCMKVINPKNPCYLSEVRPATQDEIEEYERMFVDW